MVLAHAAAPLVKNGEPADMFGWWHPAAGQLLAAAGADLDQARRVWLARFPSGGPSSAPPLSEGPQLSGGQD